MSIENPIKDLFDKLLDSEIEKKIMRQIINNKNSDDIIKSLLELKLGKDNHD